MADEKKFSESKLSYVGMRDITGVLKLKEISDPKTNTENKDGVNITKTNYGLYSITQKEKNGEIFDQRFSLNLGVDVNGSVTNLYISGENVVSGKKFVMTGSGADMQKMFVDINEAESYADDANNSIRFMVGTIDKKFVTNKALIEFIVQNRDVINGVNVKVSADAKANVWNGNSSVKGDIKGIFNDMAGEKVATAILQLESKTDRTEIEEANLLELKSKITGNYSGSIPLFMTPKSFEDINFKSRKSAFIKCKGVISVNTGRQDDNGKNIWADKLVDMNNLFQLPQAVMDLDNEELFNTVVGSMRKWGNKPKLVLASFQVTQGDEPKTDLDEQTKTMLSILKTQAEKDAYLKAIDKSIGVRGYAKEKYHIIAVNPLDANYIVDENDFHTPTGQADKPKQVTTQELKSVSAINSPSGGIKMPIIGK